MKIDKSVAVGRQEIRRFLMARRAALTPNSVGLPAGSRRRTPGLRREEVATLASVGVAWYTWLEQGRDIHVSAHVLERIARALRLTSSDTDYLFALARVSRTEVVHPVEKVDPSIQDALDGFQTGPAIFLSPCWDVLAHNRLADKVFRFDEYDGPYARNHLWRLFMDPQRRAIYLDWEALADIGVRSMRTIYGRMPDNAYLSSMIRAMCEGSEHFKRLWESQATAPPLENLRIGMKLPRFGAVYFTSVRFRPLNSQELFALLPPADEKTAAVMRRLRMSKRAAKRTLKAT